LNDIANHLRLICRRSIRRWESSDKNFGIETIVARISLPDPRSSSIGLVLEEMAVAAAPANSSPEDRCFGLVLVQSIAGAAALADPPIQVGDTITGVKVVGNNNDDDDMESILGANYEITVETLTRAKQNMPKNGILELELQRLVPRSPVLIQISGVGTIQAWEGDNLRQLLLKNHDIVLGTCGGHNECDGCIVLVDGICQRACQTIIEKRSPDGTRPLRVQFDP
jgi:hypothetical protein